MQPTDRLNLVGERRGEGGDEDDGGGLVEVLKWKMILVVEIGGGDGGGEN